MQPKVVMLSIGITPIHHANSYHKRIFLESLYINSKTNTVNDISANFPAIYYSVSKHEGSLSVAEPP